MKIVVNVMNVRVCIGVFGIIGIWSIDGGVVGVVGS